MLVATHDAFAEPATSQPQADALFAEGRDLLEKGRFPEACAKLARSEELSPAVGTLLNLGYCYEQVGKLRSAMDAYAEAETLATAAGEAKRASFAKERFAAVEPRTPRLIVRVVPPEAPGLEVKRNGTTQDYVVTATAPRHVPWRGAIIVRGEGAVVTLIVPPLDYAAAAAAPAAAPEPSPLTHRRLAALGLGALGALAIGGGIGVGLAAKSRHDDAGPHCDATGCDETGVQIQHGAAVQGNVATALVGFGLLSAAAGVYLWIVGAPEESPASRAVRVGVSPLGPAVGGRF
jgi:tetratricopeptide (TPR) repeat protein